MNLTLWQSRFGEYLQLRQFSPLTVTGYVAELTHFFAFLDAIAVKDLASVTRDVIEEYRTHLYYAEHKGKKLCAKTQAWRLGAIKAFTRFLNRERFLLMDPSAGVELPKKPTFTPPLLLSEDEARQLIAAPDVQTYIGLRDRALLELLYGTGLRSAELRGLTLDEVDLERAEIRLKSGKGGKGRVVPLGEEAALWVRRYLERSRPVLLRTASDRWVFLSQRGLRLATLTLGQVVERAARRAGIAKRVTPHLLRHCYATHLLHAGAGVRQVQKLLGHASLETTQFYTRVEISDLRDVLQKFHPRERGTKP